MTQQSIPYIFMRGGSSRGPYFLREHLPDSLDELAEVLVSVIGSGHTLNIDGIGGGVAVTTKVAILSKSEDVWADVDYFFAQVSVETKEVDFSPTCGNMLAGVGPAAIEMGLIEAKQHVTEIKIRAVNTQARVLAKVQTPNKKITYQGNYAIAGVPNTAAAVELFFMDIVGSKTGALLPTGQSQDKIDGITVTCMDVAMPMVLAKAADFGLTGYETVGDLDANKDFFARMEKIRIQAGELMGIRSVATSVIPKFALLSKARYGGHVNVRYFMPWETHPSLAVTGAQCIASCLLLPSSVANSVIKVTRDYPSQSPISIHIEHPTGEMEVVMDYTTVPKFNIHSAGLIRTARKLADGHVYI